MFKPNGSAVSHLPLSLHLSDFARLDGAEPRHDTSIAYGALPTLFASLPSSAFALPTFAKCLFDFQLLTIMIRHLR